MKINQFMKRILFITSAISFFGCKGDSSVNAPILKEYNRTSQGNYSIMDEHVAVIRNYIGSILVIGEASAHPAVRWFINKTVEAESQEKADEIFALITPSFQKKNDTIIIELNSGTIPYVQAFLELDIPYNMVCRIEKVLGNTYISHLDTSIFVQDASNVEVMQHYGSCEISSGSGDVSVETILREQDYCRINVRTGNISIKIPTDVSAEVYLKSNVGNVSQSGLTFTAIQQSPNSLTGTLGEGKGEIRAETSIGNIQLSGISH
jgi:hypothetical protein